MTKQIRTVVCAAVLFLLIFAVPAGADTLILHTNDVHGRLAENIGYDGLAAYAADCRANGDDVLLLDAGDAFQGLVYVNYFNGTSAADLMSRLGYSAMAVGNHEFDLGGEELMNLSKMLTFPMLSANVLDVKTGTSLFTDSVIINISDKKIGVFGLTTPTAKAECRFTTSANPIFVGGEEMYRIAQKKVDLLKAQGCNLIICLAHLGLDATVEPNRSSDLASHVSGIDIIIDGHSHTALPHGLQVNNTLIVSTGANFENIGVVRIQNNSLSASLVSADNYTKKDPEISRIISNYMNEVNQNLNIVIGKTDVALDGERASVRARETNLGDLVADAYLWNVRSNGIDADFALANGGTLRLSLPVGNITKQQIFNLLPFGNIVSVINVSGKTLLEIFEANTATTPELEGGFPQVSGLTYSIDTSKPYVKGQINRVNISTVNGKAFDMNAEYVMVTTDYIAAGGDKYTALAGKPFTAMGIVDASAVVRYITDKLNGSIDSTYENPQGRITILTGVSPSVPATTATATTTSSLLISGILAGLVSATLFGARLRK